MSLTINYDHIEACFDKTALQMAELLAPLRDDPMPLHTLSETARALHMSESAVRDAEQTAFRKLRASPALRSLYKTRFGRNPPACA